MKTKNLIITVFFLAVFFSFSSCSKDDNPVAKDQEVSLTTKDNVSVDKWVYFSFETNAEVSGIDSSNFQTSAEWDIAFHSRHVRLNGGASGTGQAGAVDLGEVDWETVVTAPSSGFVKDVWIDSILFAGVGEHGPIMVGTFLNPAFETAFSVDLSTYPPTYLPSRHVYVVRSRAGRYVKIMLTDYYNDKGESGYITFRYKMAAKGSMEF
jgi:hypothetical protein